MQFYSTSFIHKLAFDPIKHLLLILNHGLGRYSKKMHDQFLHLDSKGRVKPNFF